jgi:hypothetical protein
MKIQELYEGLLEGGWSSTSTQGTKITSQLVKSVLPVVKTFIDQLNQWLEKNDRAPIKMGPPLGSTSYYQKDTEDAEYGDIDLQVIAPNIKDKNDSQIARIYNQYLDEFISTTKPSMIHYEGKSVAGHPIFNVRNNFVQIDFIWVTDNYSNWAQYRATPEQGVKGVISGTVFSSFGETIMTSIQSQGAQMKIKDGQPAPYARTRKPDSVSQLSNNISNYGVDIVNWMQDKINPGVPAEISPLLKQNPGVDTKNVRVSQLIDTVKGMTDSFELNNMYGKFNISQYQNKEDHLSAFKNNFISKLQKSADSSKFDKAGSPEATAKAQTTKNKILVGIDIINNAI